MKPVERPIDVSKKAWSKHLETHNVIESGPVCNFCKRCGSEDVAVSEETHRNVGFKDVICHDCHFVFDSVIRIYDHEPIGDHDQPVLVYMPPRKEKEK